MFNIYFIWKLTSKLFKKSIFRKIEIESERFFVNTEITAAAVLPFDAQFG